MNIGNAIKEIRKEKNWTQGQLAETAGITQASLSAIESGNKQPHPSTLENLSKALGLPLSMIYFLAMEKGEVAPEKQALYDGLFPAIKGLIMQLVK